MGSETQSTIQIPKIDFSVVDPTKTDTDAWADVRSKVMDALVTYGCFEAVYPKVTSEIRDTLLDTSMKQVFSLPLETKLRNYSDKPFHGYLGQIPFIPTYESLAVMNAHVDEAVQAFTATMWPEGNPEFCKTVHTFSKQLVELDDMVVQMVFESLGVEEFFKTTVKKASKYLLRLSEYGVIEADGGEKSLGLIPHRDKNTTAIICQNGVDGLEMETKDGEWYPAAPSSDSFIVIAGDALRAWTNGRVYSPLHRILVGGKVTRYSTILFNVPEDRIVIQAPPELVGPEHPPLFKPYDYESYVRYCFTEEGQKANPQLDAFCALSKDA